MGSCIRRCGSSSTGYLKCNKSRKSEISIHNGFVCKCIFVQLVLLSELLDTFSDHRALPRENREALYSGVKETIEKHGGQIQTHNTYQLYMGRKITETDI
jgi:hypothetical protein